MTVRFSVNGLLAFVSTSLGSGSANFVLFYISLINVEENIRVAKKIICNIIILTYQIITGQKWKVGIKGNKLIALALVFDTQGREIFFKYGK